MARAESSHMNGYNLNGRTGRLGAALTATVPQGQAFPGDQSSGLFDLRAMGALPSARMRAPVPPRPPAYLPPPVQLYPRPFQAHAPLIRELRPRGRAEPYGIGWFGVFVTWLATMTLGALSSTGLPAHITARAHIAGLAAAISSPASAPSQLALPVAVSPAPVAPAASAASARPTAVPPEVGIADLPRAPATVVPPPPRPVAAQVHVRTATRAATPHAAADDDDSSSPPPAAAPAKPAPAPVARHATPAPANDSADDESAAPAPPPKPKAEAAPPPPKPAPTATFAAGSLEDLIRKEVEKEQKKLHH
jgi:hypothetical protein